MRHTEPQKPMSGKKHHELPPALAKAFTMLRPINRLPKQAIDSIAKHASLYQASVGESLAQRISDENSIHYLLEGSVQIFGSNGETETLIASDPTAKNALGRMTKSAQDVVANCPSTLVQLPWDALEKFLIQYAPAELSSTLEVQEILSSTSSDWMVRLLQFDLFSLLPAGNIQKVLASIDFVETVADEIIITEGEHGEHFYIVDQGDYLVTKQNTKTGAEVELAHLTDNDFFGEEALITDSPRGATVTSLGNGRLIKINNDTFKSCIVAPAVPLISADQADALVGKGAAYLDIRSPANLARGIIPNSAQLTSSRIRSERNTLDKQRTYVVIDEAPAMAAHAAFILRAQGYDAYCLNLPLEKYAVLQGITLGKEDERNSEQVDSLKQIELPPVQHAALPAKAAAESEHAHPMTGAGLAEIIEELNQTYDSVNDGIKLTDPDAPEVSTATPLTSEDSPTFIVSESHPHHEIIAEALAQQRASLTAEYEKKLRLQRLSAEKEIQAHRVRLENEYRAKRAGLLESRKKLIALANKISQQQAKIQRRRKETCPETKITAVEDMQDASNTSEPPLKLTAEQ